MGAYLRARRQGGCTGSTVRYYERIGLLAEPARTDSGYREYDNDAATRLLFVTRARKLGLTCEQIVELLPIWDGTNCTSTHDEGLAIGTVALPGRALKCCDECCDKSCP